MVIDYERAWVALKGEIVKKASHGKRDLLAAMGEIEVGCQVPEGEEGFDPSPPVRRNGRIEATTERSREFARHAPR